MLLAGMPSSIEAPILPDSASMSVSFRSVWLATAIRSDDEVAAAGDGEAATAAAGEAASNGAGEATLAARGPPAGETMLAAAAGVGRSAVSTTSGGGLSAA